MNDLLTVEAVQIGLEESGFQLGKCQYIDEEKGQCCPATACYIAATGDTFPFEDEVEEWLEDVLGSAEARVEFTLGIDTGKSRTPAGRLGVQLAGALGLS